VKTPGGSLRYLHIKKAGTAPKCGDCGIKLPGVSALIAHSRSEDWGWILAEEEVVGKGRKSINHILRTLDHEIFYLLIEIIGDSLKGQELDMPSSFQQFFVKGLSRGRLFTNSFFTRSPLSDPANTLKSPDQRRPSNVPTEDQDVPTVSGIALCARS
jgi:hypothetical protein